MTLIYEQQYSCSELIVTAEQDMELAESAKDFLAAQARHEALISLLNCGIEFTTLNKLNKIAKTDT